jgi:hypothetical protein
MLDAIERYAYEKAIILAENVKTYPTFTIGDVVKALDKHSKMVVQQTDRLLKSDGKTPEQREYEEFWAQDIETIVAEKFPVYMDLFESRHGFVVKGDFINHPQLMDHITSQIPINDIKDAAREIFDARLVSMYGSIAERCLQSKKTPESVLRELEKYLLKPGVSGGMVRDSFPDYELIFIEQAVRKFQAL